MIVDRMLLVNTHPQRDHVHGYDDVAYAIEPFAVIYI